MMVPPVLDRYANVQIQNNLQTHHDITSFIHNAYFGFVQGRRFSSDGRAGKDAWGSTWYQ